ncbi:hypothetical protein C5167_008073 [Papaver somniferum]|uniref:Uncharacterized protein n=2 Tax=Papaver somniferum TaxID=3469 RepID=A0A4Y7JWE8_PAPSO|nr:glucan 1,3-beta-glucosidase-like isoform X1 [Papaver somniferum]RZC64382.1 hypothetical protein C5167_008073 [Papaver somniferum]
MVGINTDDQVNVSDVDSSSLRIELDQLKAKLSLSNHFGSWVAPDIDSSSSSSSSLRIELDQLKEKICLLGNFGSLVVPEVDSSSKLKIELDQLKTKISLLGSGVDRLNGQKVKGVNLGNWLVIEGWMKPSLFQGIPEGDMLDGAKVRFKSLSRNKYVCAEEGGGSGIVTVDREKASAWETFRLWRVSQSEFQFRTYNGQFLSCRGEGAIVSTTSNYPSLTETFSIVRSSNDRVHIKLSSGTYLQVSSGNELRADYVGNPGWEKYPATFEMTFDGENMRGEYQLANGYGYEKAKQVLDEHRGSYITQADFQFLSRNGINTVRIPVGWWIAQDPNPPAPYVGGSLAALDNAFKWAQEYNIKCIIDLHAVNGSQNGWDHSAGRDGSVGWPTSNEHIQQSLDAIEFIASKYGSSPALLGIQLLNEPKAPEVPLNTLLDYYSKGYNIVRNYSATAYVIMCQLIGADPSELYHAIANMGLSNVVVDVHFYNFYQSKFDTMSPAENIQFIKESRKAQVDSLNIANRDGPLVFIGEWVNEWSFRGGSQENYQDFGGAQLDVYGSASFGWAYWSLKNVHDHWDLGWNIKNKILQL